MSNFWTCCLKTIPAYYKKSASESTPLKPGESQDCYGSQESKRKGLYTDQMNVLKCKNNFCR